LPTPQPQKGHAKVDNVIDNTIIVKVIFFMLCI
jgi:hypothetical protein